MSPDIQVGSAERVAAGAQKWMPGARGRLILLAVGDDVQQAAAIAERNQVPVHGIATIGGAADYAAEMRQPVEKTPAKAVPLSNAVIKSADGPAAPIDVLVKRRIPGLFMWGDLSHKISTEQQTEIALAARSIGGVTAFRVRERYHLLSQRSDDDWMELDMVDQVATAMRHFVDEYLRPQPRPRTSSKPRELTAGLD